MSSELQLYTNSVKETRNAGARLASIVKPGDIYALEGDLGTGKTEFVRGFTVALGDNIAVRSPSFSILNIYQTPKINVYHFDFYRLADSSELFQLGFDDYLSGDGVCMIEWGTMFPDTLPEHAKVIKFTDKGNSTRLLEADLQF